jgi:phosphotransferase system enzyme I (PtsP)
MLLDLIGVPAITDVVGAFRWLSPEDIALVDGDHGFLILNPSRADIAAFRAERRRNKKGRSNDRLSQLPEP